jgi:hypothetical protein
MAMPVSFVQGAPRRSFAARAEELNPTFPDSRRFRERERAFDPLTGFERQIAVAAKPPSSERPMSKPLPENG